MIRSATSVLFLALPYSFAAMPNASAQTIERISVSSSGAIADRFVETLTRASDDGRFVAFTTSATNLVAPDAPFTPDVFLRDRLAGTTVRVRSNGVVSDLTPNGQRLAYYRTPTAVTAVVDIAAGTEFALTTPPILSNPGRFSADGRFLLYQRGDAGTGGPTEVVRREIVTAVDDLVSSTFMGMTNSVIAFPGHLSADGTIATFTTADPDIVPGDMNGMDDAFYKDYGFGFSDRTSVSSTGAELPGDSSAGAVTPDTRYFLFTTQSAAVPEDTNGTWDLYVSDRFLGELRRASVSTAGTSGNAATQSPAAWIANDGTRVIFESSASNLVAGDTNAVRDVFEHNFSTNTTRRIVLGIGGAQVDADLELRGVSADGRYLTILSAATNLAPGATNGDVHAYLVDLGPQCFVIEYCSALPNSTGETAVFGSSGMPSFTLNNFVLSTFGLPSNAACTFFHGTQRADPPAVFGDGLRCVTGTLKRLGNLVAVGGGAIQFQDLNSTPYIGVVPGDVRRFQVYYRDVNSSGAGFNTSAALEVTFCP